MLDRCCTILFLLCSLYCSFVISFPTTTTNLKAAVLVPGFLTGADDFQTLCDELTSRGVPTISVPFPNWQWIPCLGGRSVRPILERIDFTVKHLVANNGDITKIPPYEYTLNDLWVDFRTNPGGLLQVGGSDKVDEYPIVEPQGTFPPPEKIPSSTKVALIGHSAGGWISRVYLSGRNYGGKSYNGKELIHSLVTLGTPHGDAPGPAFEGVKWTNREDAASFDGVKCLTVGGTGFKGGEWGSLTQGSYAFCCPKGTNGTLYTGDGVTPIQSALGMADAEQMTLPGCTHFCWSDAGFGADMVAPELTQDHREGRPWYGSPEMVDKWSTWLLEES